MKKTLTMLLAALLLILPMASLAESYAVFDNLRMALPDGASVVGAEICDAQMQPIIYVSSAFFEESVLMEEYGYTTQEECVRGVVEALGGVTILDGGAYAPGVNGFPLYVYHCAAQKFMPPDGVAEQSNEPLTLALLIDTTHELIYPIFFYGEMAVDQAVLDVLNTVSLYENNYGQRALEGLYAWEGGAEYYLD